MNDKIAAQCNELRRIQDDMNSLLNEAYTILNNETIKKEASYSIERAFHYWLNPMRSLIGNEDVEHSPVVSMSDTIDDLCDL